MKNYSKTPVSINDFNDKCRICLHNYSEMIDIFASGISEQVMEVINIKITSNDRLPKGMCQECIKQLEECYKFQNLAKDSDNYLRALLIAEQSHSSEIDSHVRKRKRKLEIKKKMKNSDQDLMNDKMYLILVPGESESQNEIEIKDVENEDVELTDFCRSLIKRESDDTSPCDGGELNLMNSGVSEGENAKRIFTVSVMIYQCNECDECFESKDLLIEHTVSCHESNVICSEFEYNCPVCSLSETNRSLFMDHLKKHKSEGFMFLKVDKNGKYMTLNGKEEEVFEVPKLIEKSKLLEKVFKINMDCYKCLSCKKVEEVCSMNDHLKNCFPGFSDEDYDTPHMKYVCPACCDIWVDDLNSFNAHLLSHRSELVFFVKVDSSGNPIDVEEVPFTTFEKALSLLPFRGEGCSASDKRIIKMRGIFSCFLCDFEANSSLGLSEHFLHSHGDATQTCGLSCPVCFEQFKCTGMEDRITYYTHMKCHRDEGVCFIKIDASGNVVNDGDPSLFCDVQDLFRGKIVCPEMEFITNVHVPEVFMKEKVEDVHKMSRDYVCEKCGKKCFGKGNYKRHFSTHTEKAHGQRRPKCSVCGKAFANRAAMNEHRKYHEGVVSDDPIARTICEVCGRKLSNNASLAKHRRLHETEKESLLLKCKICERGFRRESSLNRHVSAHLNPNYFECEECKLPLPSAASLQRHRLSHQGSSSTFDCKVCKVSFLTKDRLNAHQTHTGHQQDRKRFECNVCHERFFVGREFSRHIKLHPKYKMSECTLCGKRLSTVQSLMLHLSRHFESNSILCPHCGKQFFEERNYHRHLLTHKGVKPFACDFENCNKSFYTYFELNRHKKYHNNTRDFSCQYCPKSFHEANHLKVHIRTHTGEKPYTCPHCSKGFVTRTRCKQHINLIHQGIGCDLIQSSISKKVAVFEAFEAPS